MLLECKPPNNQPTLYISRQCHLSTAHCTLNSAVTGTVLSQISLCNWKCGGGVPQWLMFKRNLKGFPGFPRFSLVYGEPYLVMWRSILGHSEWAVVTPITRRGGQMSRASICHFWEIGESEHCGFKPWSTKTNDFKSWYLPLSSQALGIIRTGQGQCQDNVTDIRWDISVMVLVVLFPSGATL